MMDFHFIRPFWLLALIPWLFLAWYLLRQTPKLSAWSKVCDSHLLPYLLQTKSYPRRVFPLFMLLSSALLMIVSLTGPSWVRMPVPTYQKIQARVLVLDMSAAMLAKDLLPDNLSRAKFKLHDLLQHKDVGQFALVVYAGEPFVASPLTDDGQTIDALLSSLTADVMPVAGQQLASALQEARKLINQAGFQQGQILVLTASAPKDDDIEMAKDLAHTGVDTSIMPVIAHDAALSPLFGEFAKAGQGSVISFSDTSSDLDQWLTATFSSNNYAENMQNEIPEWRDEGPWFLIPALLFLLPAFRRGWVQGIGL